jgi:hypothetical protein
MLQFDEKKHEYRKDGNIIPSTTQILKAEGLSDFSMIKEDVLEYSLALGSAVHYGAELHELGTLDESTVDPSVKLRLDQWLLFLEGAKRRGWLDGEKWFERRLFSTLQFAGTPDRVYYHDQRIIVIDIKTGVKVPGAALQTAAYEILAREQLKSEKKRVLKSMRMCVYLKDDSFELVEHKDVFDSANFRSLLNVYNYKKKWNLY